MTENRVWQAVTDGLSGRSQKPAQTGFTNICCPMCVERGETADRRHRCGIRYDGSLIGVYCFNCDFRGSYRLGQRLGRAMRGFLANLGLGGREIALLGLWAEQMCRVAEAALPAAAVLRPPSYAVSALPDGAQSLQTWVDRGCVDPWFVRVAAYLLSRGDVAARATTYYWTPDTARQLHRHLIIPCYYQRRLVGWTARAVDPGLTRYVKEVPSNFLFNLDALMQPRRKYVLLVEGVIDALVLDAVGALGASLNEQQIAWINQSGKRPVVVPDRDAAGSRLVEVAIRQQWSVATPHYGRHQWWDGDIKDAADAVNRYGRLYTVQSILNTLETHAGLIRMRSSYSRVG